MYSYLEALSVGQGTKYQLLEPAHKLHAGTQAKTK
jgi:hypothetical protein